MSRLTELVDANAAIAASLAATNERMLKITQEQATLLEAIAEKDDRIADLEAQMAAGDAVPADVVAVAKANQAKAENIGRLTEIMDQLVPDVPAPAAP